MKNTAHELIAAKTLLKPDERTATETGSGVGNDQQGFGEALIVLQIGAVSGTTPTLAVKIQESSDNGVSDAFVDVAGATFGTKVTADANKVFVARIDLQQREKFLRAVATIGGTTPSFDSAVVMARIGNEELPVSQDFTAEFSV